MTDHTSISMSTKPHNQARRVDVAGQKFGRLTALKYEGWNGAYKTLWSFRCQCGETIVRRLATVRRGEIKSCGCMRREGGYKAHNRKPEGESSFNTLFSHYQRSARMRGHEFTLNREDFRDLTVRGCHYCGLEPSQIIRSTVGGNGTYTYTGIDRINNDDGYSVGNVVPCCAMCNRAKSTVSQDDFIRWIARSFHHLKDSGHV